MQLINEAIIRTPTASVGIQAMIVSRDEQVVNLFSDVLGHMGIDIKHYADESTAVSQVGSARFEAVVLDFDTVAEMAFLIQCIHESRSNRNALVFGLATEASALQRALQEQINVPFQRPLQKQRVVSILSAGYGLMLRDRRRYFRYGISVPVRLTRSSREHLHCTSINISQNGTALCLTAALKLGESVEIVLAIPGVEGLVSARGTVIWDDKHGKAGVRFECSSADDEKRLGAWLDAHFYEQCKQIPMG